MKMYIMRFSGICILLLLVLGHLHEAGHDGGQSIQMGRTHCITTFKINQQSAQKINTPCIK
jgi:hypothetical protein